MSDRISMSCAVLISGVFLLAGCAGPAMNRVEGRLDLLESRVSELESDQLVLAEHVARGRESASIPSIVVAPEAPARPARDPESLTDRDIQRALRAGGYYTGAIDGVVGPKTRSAIRRFQRDHGLKVDGIAGRATKGAIVRHLDW